MNYRSVQFGLYETNAIVIESVGHLFETTFCTGNIGVLIFIKRLCLWHVVCIPESFFIVIFSLYSDLACTNAVRSFNP